MPGTCRLELSYTAAISACKCLEISGEVSGLPAVSCSGKRVIQAHKTRLHPQVISQELGKLT